MNSRTLSTPESGARAGYDGAKRRKGSKIHAAALTLGHDITRLVTAASDQVYDLCRELDALTGGQVEVVLADQGYTGEQASTDAALNTIELVVSRRPAGATGFVLISKRWIVEHTFAWTARFRRLARDVERLEGTLLGFHWLALSLLLLHKLHPIFATST